MYPFQGKPEAGEAFQQYFTAASDPEALEIATFLDLIYNSEENKPDLATLLESIL